MEFTIVVLAVFLVLSIVSNWLYSELYKAMKVRSDMQDKYIDKLVGEITDYKKQLGTVTVKKTEAEVIEIKRFQH